MSDMIAGRSASRKTVVLAGHSHAAVIDAAHQRLGASDRFSLKTILFHDQRYNSWGVRENGGFNLNPVLVDDLTAAIQDEATGCVAMAIAGNNYWSLGLFNSPDRFDFVIPGRERDFPLADGAAVIPYHMVQRKVRQDELVYYEPLRVAKTLTSSLVCILPQPPTRDDAHTLAGVPAGWPDPARVLGISPAGFRYKVWLAYDEAIRAFCEELQVTTVSAPAHTLDADGFLKLEYSGDGLHGNLEYGNAVLTAIEAHMSAARAASAVTNPYHSQPRSAFWRRSVAQCEPGEVDPVVKAKFQISRADKVATSGSCFAQHIARKLADTGFNYFVTERIHPAFALGAEKSNYGTYSARFGNVYTARQLLQLLLRAYGEFQPLDDVWAEPDGTFKDPFRPEIQPGGFPTMLEFRNDRQRHFAAVREMVEGLDVLVFTLGLTEAWFDGMDGAVFPLCPGVSGGTYQENRHYFVNFSVDEVAADLSAAFAFIKARNARARFIVTVSPVPLIATYEKHSVITATAYSKAVLRVAAERVCSASPDAAYFPSYEVITGNHSRGAYFEKDLRSITDAGVSHVMRLFLRHYADVHTPAEPAAPSHADTVEASTRQHLQDMRKLAAIICDEERLDPS
jgi:hypothetical protein